MVGDSQIKEEPHSSPQHLPEGGGDSFFESYSQGGTHFLCYKGENSSRENS